MKDLDAVYRQHAQTVYKFLLSQCRDPQTAEELTQETFYQAVRSIDRFDGSCKVSVWLCQIAKHLWYQHLRKANRETELPEEAELPLVPSAEEEAVSRRWVAVATYIQTPSIFKMERNFSRPGLGRTWLE